MKILKPILRKRFKCDFCNHSVYYSEYAAKSHEDKCYKNPERNCPTCKNTGKVENLYDGDDGTLELRMDNCHACKIAEECNGKSYLVNL